MWIEILNKSYKEHIKINRNSVLGFVVIEPEYLSFKHEMTKAKRGKDTTENVELLDEKEKDNEEAG